MNSSRIVIFGATSIIARDLVKSLSKEDNIYLLLVARKPELVRNWLDSVGIGENCEVTDWINFNALEKYDVLINFVGVGSPAAASKIGNSILEITNYYDQIAISYVKKNPDCRYIFLSSGAVYGSDFSKPVNELTDAKIPITRLKQQNWYGISKLYAECLHRSLDYLPIVDIRIFSYFSNGQDINSGFFITDLLRSIKKNMVFKTSDQDMIRDYINPEDFHQLVSCVLKASPKNMALDCYSAAPITKFEILNQLVEHFGLQYEFDESNLNFLNPTGDKQSYYSLNHQASSYGYKPLFTSLQTILIEGRSLLAKKI